MKIKLKKIISIFLLIAFCQIVMPVNALNYSSDCNETTIKKHRKYDVFVCPNEIVIKKGAILKFIFTEDIDAKNVKINDPITFALGEDLLTKENQLILPKGTLLKGYVRDLQQAESMNTNAKIFVTLRELELTPENKIDITARVKSGNGALQRPTALNALRIASIGGGTFVLSSVLMVVGIIFLLPVMLIATIFIAPTVMMGSIVGGTYMKGLNFKVSKGSAMNIELAQDLVIPR